MVTRLLIPLLFYFITVSNLTAQPFPTEYFIPPLDGVLQVSGTFAELRGNHFHSGIDFRTNSKEGMPVHAVADGYVVRIKISAFGFGKAIYINHPNGFTSVYAHMQKFDDKIADWIRARQYENESFEVDLFPPKDLFRVTKGEIIGNSGNSGSSEGPHLHFELRETDTELPVDPLLFDFPVKDWIRPTMHGLRIYPEGLSSLVNDLPEPSTLELAGWGPVYRLKITDTITVAGNFSIGISASDLLNETSNRNGVNSFEVYIDSVIQFQWRAVKFNFNETRYINSFLDYPFYYQSNRRFMRTHIDPGNRLSMYSNKLNVGVFKAIPGKLQYVKVVLKDSKQNESILQFIVKGEINEIKRPDAGQLRADISNDVTLNNPPLNEEKSSDPLFRYNKLNTFSTPGMMLNMPAGCLYDSIFFSYSETPVIKGMYSPVHVIHNPEVPLQDYYELALKVNGDYKGDTKKLIMVRLSNQNKPFSVGGHFDKGYIKSKIRDFGRYSIMADTTAPVINLLNLKDGLEINKLQEFRIAISDNLSGIKTYKATLNGAWILLDYDAKSRLLVYKRDALLLPGENKLVITIEDNVGNSAIKQMTLRN